MQRCRIGQGECRFRWSKRISIIVVMGRTDKRIRQRELGLGHAQHADMMWGQDYQESIDRVHSAVQQFVYAEEYWGESNSWKMKHGTLKSTSNSNTTYMWTGKITASNYHICKDSEETLLQQQRG